MADTARLTLSLRDLIDSAERLMELVEASNSPTPAHVLDECAEELCRDAEELRSALKVSECHQ